MSNVASQYVEEQKQSRNTPAPLPELRFFYEGTEVICYKRIYFMLFYSICLLLRNL